MTRTLVDRGGQARSFVLDVSDEAQVQALFDDAVAAHGGVDVVFANAGIAAVPGFGVEGGQTLDTVERADWDRVLGINLSGVLFTMKAATAVMKRQGAGKIIVTASAAGLKPEPMVCYGYSASKGAVVNMVRQAALELAPQGIMVNAICPGPFKGTMIGGGVTQNPEPELEEAWSSTIPLRRMAAPEELKGLVVLLASPASSFITGHAHVIDGGVLTKG
jgi:NAD(P)-dependent dehydrogenase (short-subunit alcohol dehydrogenase family)